MPPTPSATFEEPKQKDHWNCKDWNCKDGKDTVPVASHMLLLIFQLSDVLLHVLVVLPYRVDQFDTDPYDTEHFRGRHGWWGWWRWRWRRRR